MIADTTTLEPAGLVELLADVHRRFAARTRLIALGRESQPAVIAGLRHRDPSVRAQCCEILDRVADSDGLEGLASMLDDPVAAVRIQALHALACDRCKDKDCERDSSVLPRALDVLRNDEDRHVRAHAVELVGVWVHTDPAAAHALVEAAATDSCSTVRKKASWYAPGGPVWRRTRLRAARPSH